MNQIDPIGAAVARARVAGGGGGGGGGRIRGGGGGGGGRVAAPRQPAAAKPGKPPAYEPNTESNPGLYNMDKMRADFDGVYGKGAFDKVYPQLNANIPSTGANGTAPPGGTDAKGKPVGFTGLAKDPQTGNLTYFENGAPNIHIGAQDIQDKWQGRFNTARYNAGLAPLNLVPPDTVLGGAAASLGKTAPDAGSARNPYTPKDAWSINNVPYGSTYVDPRDGQIHTRQSLADKQQIMADQQEAMRVRGMPVEPSGAGGGEDQTDDLGRALISGDERRIRDILAAAPEDQTDDLGRALLKGDDQGVIDALNVNQPDTGGGNVAAALDWQNWAGGQPVAGPSPSDLYPGSAAVTQAAASADTRSPSDFYPGSPALASAQPSTASTAAPSPSDFTSGNPLSYLSPMAATPPPAQPPDVSPNATGEAAATTAAAAATPNPSDAYVGLPGGHPDLPVATYLGGY